jgi:hypothetical protein
VNDSVRDEHGIHVTGHPLRIVSQRHGRTTDDEHVRDNASPEEPLSQGSERALKLSPAEQDVIGPAHAASRSRADR